MVCDYEYTRRTERLLTERNSRKAFGQSSTKYTFSERQINTDLKSVVCLGKILLEFKSEHVLFNIA